VAPFLYGKPFRDSKSIILTIKKSSSHLDKKEKGILYIKEICRKERKIL